MPKHTKRTIIVDPYGDFVAGTDQHDEAQAWAAMFDWVLTDSQLAQVRGLLEPWGWRAVEVKIPDPEE